MRVGKNDPGQRHS